MDGHDAFGISKSYNKLFPKLSGTKMWKDKKIQPHDTMDSKLRQHSVANRLAAGGLGGRVNVELKRGEDTTRSLARAKERKKAAHGMYAAISRNNKKKGRTLP